MALVEWDAVRWIAAGVVMVAVIFRDREITAWWTNGRFKIGRKLK